LKTKLKEIGKEYNNPKVLYKKMLWDRALDLAILNKEEFK
jgi:hypothetical protein